MGFFSKLINAIKGGNKEELGKLADEALDKVSDVAKDLGEKIVTRSMVMTSKLPRTKSAK